MGIIYSQTSGEFHLFNHSVSYILQILPNGEIGNLYFGKKVRHKDDFSYLLEGMPRALTVYSKEDDYFFSPGHTRMEYPAYGRGDFREHAFEVLQENGSRITDFKYKKHEIYAGKRGLEGLPAVYTEADEEAESLEITLTDELLNVDCILKYSIFRDYPVITRSVEFVNRGEEKIALDRVMSCSFDLPDSEFEMISLAGAWARERRVITRKIAPGLQEIGSHRGASSSEQNPFIALKRPNADENSGEVYGVSLIYSGNHREAVEVDSYGMTRVQAGIHPDAFQWQLLSGEHFQTPEAVLTYTEHGLNAMSQAYHRLYRTRLCRGYWRDRLRPVLINNWEATYMDFTEEKLIGIAKAGKELGIDLFVMDDGWFGNREDDHRGLGDWYVKNFKKLPGGIPGLAEKVEALGMKFGLWFEPEMVNKDSDLYREHPDWILCAPGRHASPSRNQHVLDFSREEVVDYIYGLMEKVLSDAPVGYVKWDMNRYISECFSMTASAADQGKVYHKYILGVYRLYERLTARFPEILFESCSSGGARFDPGLLYYAPQTWTSDDTDAVERLAIQYGTSYVYPLSSMGAHVSAVPNHQTGRVTSMKLRGDVALFGMMGYELDLERLTDEEKEAVKGQIALYRKHQQLIMSGDFYRLASPLDNENCAWMVVDEKKETALAGYYQIKGIPNGPWLRLKLQGLDADADYVIAGREGVTYGGDELMNVGIVIDVQELGNAGEYCSVIFELKRA